MYKLCKTEQSAARQRLLEQGLLELMEQTRYDKLTVSDICTHLDIPRKAFYRYFPTKDDALHALIDHTFLDMANFPVQEEDGEDPFLREMRRVFGYWSRERRFLKVMEDSGLTELLFQRVIPIARSEMDIFRRYLAGMPPRKQEYVVGFFTGGIITMLLRWHDNDCVESPEQMARTAAALLEERK